MAKAPKSPFRPRLTMAAVGLMVLVGAIIIILDFNQVRQLAGKAEWGFLSVALVSVTLSYFCETASMVVLFRVFNIGLDQPYLLKVSFVSAVLSNLIALPAAIGLQLLILGQRGINQNQIIGSSLLRSYFKNLVFYSLIPPSLVYIIFTYPMVLGGVVSMSIIIVILVAAIAAASIMVFNTGIRTFIFKILGHIWHLLTRRDIRPSLSNFENAITDGISVLKRQRSISLLLAALVLGDVALMITALWFCFKALNVPVHLGALITAFNFGITLTVISFIPGDLGVQEASIAGILAIFGVVFTQGILIAIAFRAIYYFIPFIVSLGFYWGMLKETRQGPK